MRRGDWKDVCARNSHTNQKTLFFLFQNWTTGFGEGVFWRLGVCLKLTFCYFSSPLEQGIEYLGYLMLSLNKKIPSIISDLSLLF